MPASGVARAHGRATSCHGHRRPTSASGSVPGAGLLAQFPTEFEGETDERRHGRRREAGRRRVEGPRLHRAHRRQGAAPGDHLPRPVPVRDRALAPALPRGRVRDLRDRRASRRARRAASTRAARSTPGSSTRPAPARPPTTRSRPRRSRSRASSRRTGCASCSPRRSRTSTGSASSASSSSRWSAWGSPSRRGSSAH